MDHDAIKKITLIILVLIVCFSICSDLIMGICLVIISLIIYDALFATNNENFDDVSDKISTRQRHLNFLNKDRGKIGHFLVNCGRCGRQGILDKISEVSKSSPDCPYATDQYNGGQYNGDEMNGKAQSCNGCNHKCNDTMSFFNNKYIDTKQIFCYNCLLDTDTHMLIRNYQDFPSVNGPPGTNSFTH